MTEVWDLREDARKETERRRFRYDLFLSAALHGYINEGYEGEELIEKAQRVANLALETKPEEPPQPGQSYYLDPFPS